MTTLINAGASEIQSGIWTSVAAPEVPLWADGQDILFHGGGARAIASNQVAYRSEGEVKAMAQASVESLVDGELRRQTRLYWISNGLFYCRYHNKGDIPVVLVFSGMPVNLNDVDWFILPYGQGVFVNNVENGAYYWNGDTDSPVLTKIIEGEERAQLLTKLGPHLIVGNVTYSNSQRQGNEVRWADATDPTTWIPDTTNTAGSLVLRDLESDIKAFAPLGNRLAVYGQDSMGALTFIGGQLVFGFSRLFDNIGAVGAFAVVSVGYENYGMSRQGIWRTDGSTVVYVDEPALRQFIQDDVDWENAHTIRAFHDEDSQLVVFYYPQAEQQGDSLNAGVGYNYANKTWTRFKSAFGVAIERSVFPHAVVSKDETLAFHNIGKGSENTLLTTKPLSASPSVYRTASERYSIWRALRFSFSGNLYVRLGFSDTREAYSFTGDEPAYKCAPTIYIPERESVYIILQFFTETKEEWQLHGFSVDGLRSGELF